MILLLDIWEKQEHDSPLNEILSETEVIPAYTIFGDVYLEDSITSIGSLCHEKDLLLKEILCIKDKTIYFLCEMLEGDQWYWAIGIAEAGGTEVQIQYKMTVSNEINYRRAVTSDYKDRYGYYYDGEIVLNDRQTVLTYGIDSGEIQKYNYDDYQFPERMVYGECIDNHILVLNIEDSNYEYSLQDMATQSVGISKLFALKDKKIHNGNSYIEYFFASHNSIQCIKDKIYVIGRCMNYGGSSGAVFLEYDIEKDKWIYVVGKHIPLGDDIHVNCYVIPQHN